MTNIAGTSFSYCGNLVKITVAPENPVYVSLNDLLLTRDGMVLVRGVDGDAVIPDGVVSIGNYAFSGCSGLAEVMIPDGVVDIGYRAFSGCKGLMEVLIPNSVTNIDDSAFYDCRSLMEVTIPNGVTRIGDFTFYGCKSLMEVVIPNGVTNIGYSAFSGCSGLTEVTIPDGVTDIGRWAFSQCTGLTNVWLPKRFEGVLDTSVFDGLGDSVTMNYYENTPVDIGGGRMVTVPGDWLGKKTVRTATDVAANGRKVWECYLLGLDPERADDDFRIVSFALKDGKPVFTFNHTEDGSGTSFVPRIRTLGKARLEDADWTEVPVGGELAFRFFKAEVALP